MKLRNTYHFWFAILSGVGVLLLVLTGCSQISAPTQAPAGEPELPLWNPAPGDRIGTLEVPLVCDGYWESFYGAQINPLNLPPRTMHIGPEGGVINLGPHRLVIPAGAVDADITFSVSNASATGIASDCGPGGLTFQIPVTLVLSYRGTQYEDIADAPDLHIYYLASDGGIEQRPSVVDHEAKTVSATLDHFSRYILG